MKKRANEYDIISDAQFGFKSNFSTTDAIFILNSLIENQLNKKGSLFCCFIDLQKCFDSTYRGDLWYKLIDQGLDSKLFKVIRSIYDEIKLCVKHSHCFSKIFECKAGLLQGEILSPIMFSLFVNDIESCLQQNSTQGYEIDDLTLFLLLFADDSVLLSETAEGLQNLINNVEKYCKKWNLTVNVNRQKLLFLKKGD